MQDEDSWKETYDPDTPEYFCDGFGHVSPWHLLLRGRQSHHLATRICERGDNQNTTKSPPAIIDSSRHIPILYTLCPPIEAKSQINEKADDSSARLDKSPSRFGDTYMKPTIAVTFMILRPASTFAKPLTPDILMIEMETRNMVTQTQ